MKHLSVELSDEKVQDFNLLETELQVSALDIVNNALSLFEWAVQELKRGRQIASIGDKSYDVETVKMPIFENITVEQRPNLHPL